MSMGRSLVWEKQKGLGTGYRWGGRSVGDDYGRWVGCNWESSQYQNGEFDVNFEEMGNYFLMAFS